MPRFAPGRSGNPSGARTSPRAVVHRMVGEHVEQLVEQQIARALSGDQPAIEAVIGIWLATTPRSPARTKPE